MTMAVAKENGAKWLVLLYDKFQREQSVIINGIKHVGIVDALKEDDTTLDEEDDTHTDPFDDHDCDSDKTSDKENRVVLVTHSTLHFDKLLTHCSVLYTHFTVIVAIATGNHM